MVQRTPPQRKTDRHAFPITVRVMVPHNEFSALGQEIDPWDWLRIYIGFGEFAQTHHQAFIGEAVEFHFRAIEDANRFLERFPELTLCDDTMSKVYRSPYVPFGRGDEGADVCNLYSNTTAQEAMRQLFAGVDDRLGNLPPQPEIYPDQLAPILRHGPEGLEMVTARWGMPTPPQFLVGKKADRGITNIRNAKSPHWRRWLGPQSRCLVPLTRFSEPDSMRGGNVWFSFSDGRPAFFAGLQVPAWRSVRKVKDGESVDDLFGFLTCEPNAEVVAVHPKAMPVILTERQEWDTWLNVPWDEAKGLQRPLPSGSLQTG